MGASENSAEEFKSHVGIEAAMFILSGYVRFIFMILQVMPVTALLMKLFRIPKPEPQPGEVRFGLNFLTSGISGVIAGVGLLISVPVIAIFETFEEWMGWAVAGGLVLLILSPYLLAQYMKARHFVSPEGFRYGRVIGPDGFVRWDEVEEVDFSACAWSFELKSRDGRVIRVCVYAEASTLKPFGRTALEKIDPDAINKRLRGLLLTTARGVPPRPYGIPGRHEVG